MIDYCSGPSCPMYKVSRSADSRPLQVPWYCSKKCRDIATRPQHWREEGTSVSVCGLANAISTPHLVTSVREDVTCCCCKNTGLWKMAEAA